MRVLKVLHRELWLRRIPHGAVSPQFLWTRNPQIKAHSEMFLNAKPGWPKPAYLAVETILWINWIGLFGWLALFRTLRHLGRVTRDEYGISFSRQILRLLRTTFWTCLPPVDAYRFGVITQPEQRWSYVSDRHIAAFHAWRNRSLETPTALSTNLADKFDTGKILQSQGIDLVPIVDCVTSDQDFDLIKSLKKHRRLFCKTRSGSSGLGAFECWIDDGEIVGRRFEKGPLCDQNAVLQAWEQLLRRDEALVQPVRQNHPLLAPLAPDSRAITVRCITQRDKLECNILCATLEIPTEHSQDSYVILPVDIESGKAKRVPLGFMLHSNARKAYVDIMERLENDQVLPGWSGIISQSKVAHCHFDDNWAVAWDWVLTHQGPVLLEGNRGFGGTIPQIMTGGFLETI